MHTPPHMPPPPRPEVFQMLVGESTGGPFHLQTCCSFGKGMPKAEFERLPEGCHQESGPTGIACRRFTKIGTTRRLVEAI
jgi:hypothetical protein